jgi:osmotically-inducible protein OsmY
MLTATLSRADVTVREDVVHQLEWDPEVDASAIGVTADDGAVTLSGFIDSYAGKLAAERAAKRVRGVRAVANELEVRLKFKRADDEIARDAAHALSMHTGVPHTVQATVHHGHLILTGHVPWQYHRVTSELAVRGIKGVLSVVNRLTVRPLASYTDVRHRITEALHRIADVNARHVVVTIKGTTATLSGSVRSWAQRDAVEHAAAAAPGIAGVENLIEVVPGAYQ